MLKIKFALVVAVYVAWWSATEGIFAAENSSSQSSSNAAVGSVGGPVGIALPVPLSFPSEGLASVGIYDVKGTLIRTLSYAKPVEQGDQTWSWDGTTDLGLPAEPGAYTAKGVWFTKGPQISYVMKIGVSGEPPYLTDDEHSGWGAVHGPATAICANDKNLLAVFQTSESPRETGIQLMDFNGKIVSRFASFFPFDNRMACTMDDKELYLAIASSRNGVNRVVIGKYDLNAPPKGKILCDIPVGDHFGTEGRGKGRWRSDILGLALSGGKLYVPSLYDDKVFVVDTETGQIAKTLAIPSPRGIAAFGGKIFVISGTQLVSLNADGQVMTPSVLEGLQDPSGLAIDQMGNFYIADGGNSQQVKKFSPSGKELQEFGLKGGRPRSGIYNPEGMLDPRGICVAPDGKVWVATIMDDFQELIAWNPDGTRADTFYNAHWSSGQGRLSPDRTEMLFGSRLQNSNPGVSAYRLNLADRTWEPSWHLSLEPEMMDQREVLLGWKPNNEREQIQFDNHQPYLSFDKEMILGTNGKTYLTGGDFSIWMLDPATKKVTLASVPFPHHVLKTPEGPYQANYDQGPPNWMTWSDLNGDGKMALDEVNYVENPPTLAQVPKISQIQLQSDLSLMMVVGTASKGIYNVENWRVCRLKPSQVLPSGVPVYDWNQLEKVVDLQMPNFLGGDGDPGRQVTRVGLDQFDLANGAAYVTAKPSSKAKLHLTGIDGDGWWASRNWRISPMKFDLITGQPAWLKMGRRTAGRAKPGEMYYPGWGLAGSSHGVNFFADTLSQVWAWTDEGLYLGPVYDTEIGESNYGPNSLHVELIGSYIYDIGDKTYILTGDHGVSMHELTLPALKPLNGRKLTLTADDVAQVKPWDPDGPPPGKRPTYIAPSIYDFDKKDPKPIRSIAVDGKLEPSEWKGVPLMDIKREGKTVGTVRVTFDKTNLYLAYDITDPNGLKNDGHELPLAPFVTGSYVDFSIGSDWTTPNRSEVLDGDARVIMARITGSPSTDYQMGFWPIKRELKSFLPKNKKLVPQDIVSPVATKHFDDIDPVSGLTFAYQLSSGGYTLEAAVPFASLGINPAKNAVVGFDVSAGFADAAGKVRNLALHWAGETETEVVDRPGSAELKPKTWGTLQFDRTPVALNEGDSAKQK